ncbi:threonine--tRNA ligase [Candidatus Woesebacteria bacterium]|nr:threonine--tRNA ligase [Candidatus Woesebacteria bacterium]
MKKELYLEHLRHSCAHLLAAAVMELWPSTKRTIGPAIDSGFYFDFEFETPISESDFPAIEERMHVIAKTWKEFSRKEVSVDEAKKEYSDNAYKLELIEEFAEKGDVLSLYQSGDYSDLCRGGHVDHPDEELHYFKLLSVAGAYWRGSEKNAMLTRIYGTCFPSQKELDAHLEMLEEAKKRDHRKIGKDQELFFIDEMVGKGLIMWLPNGTILRDQVEKLAKEHEELAGYVRVATPHIAKEELFLTSGHLPYYKDSMYPPMVMDDGTYYLKAMNCPHHHRIYQHKPRSYKELPLRFAEYGTCYRNELSGALAGLLRVRGMSMNDAHIYARKDQIKEEFANVLKLTMEYFKIFGLKDYWFRLSKWDPANTEKYIDEPENWELSQNVLREVLQELDVKFIEADDEAAFYGPKVDVQFKSAIGREETMSTIQLDFAAKKRFGLHYIDESGAESNEVFVIHRAPLSVHERFLAFMIEHFAGSFPLWLSPVQAVIIPISQEQQPYAQELLEKFKSAGIRIENWDEAESMQNRIRKAEQQRIPYMLVVGNKEAQAATVSVRARGNVNRGVWEVEKFIAQLVEKNANRDLAV